LNVFTFLKENFKHIKKKKHKITNTYMYQLNSLVKNKLFIAKHRKSYLANN